MAYVFLTQTQIDWIADACVAAVDERDRFLRDAARCSLARALYAMDRPREAALIAPEGSTNDRRGHNSEP